MKEAYFKAIKWTKTFVTGPLDPLDSKYEFYSQICKTNVSIKSIGVRDVVRHYQSDSHLRKDQRWRFKHLANTNEITGVTSHEVRGKDGHVLTPLELEREKPFFIDAPLVDIGDKDPFFDEYMAGIGAFSNPSEILTSMQIFLVGLFVPYCGNIPLLQTLWAQVRVPANHQELFSLFDWGATTLRVSLLFNGSKNTEVTLPDVITFSFFPFQIIFHHIFSCAIADISSHVSATGLYSLEFEKKGMFGLVYVWYWKSASLVRVYLCRYKLMLEHTAGIVNSISRVLSVLSSKRKVVSVSGCPVELVQTLD